MVSSPFSTHLPLHVRRDVPDLQLTAPGDRRKRVGKEIVGREEGRKTIVNTKGTMMQIKSKNE